jgi:carotenoid 1,2-hydratase
VSDDGLTTIVVIGMLGNVFSPAYRDARARHGLVSPLGYCTMNVALYDRQSPAWALTELPVRELHRETLRIGGSSMRLCGSTLVVSLDEETAPFAGRIRGELRIDLGDAVLLAETSLDAGGLHRWLPIAPHARASVRLTEPRLAFEGAAYVDSNAGDEPLERGFSAWSWSRATLADGRTVVSYDVVPRTGEGSRILLQAEAGTILPLRASVPAHRLPRTRFGLSPNLRLDTVRHWETLEDTPFYARTRARGRLFGQEAVAVHEELSLDRFEKSWVQFLLPFRMRGARPFLRRLRGTP